jgi:hypothetical protein
VERRAAFDRLIKKKEAFVRVFFDFSTTEAQCRWTSRGIEVI